MPPKARVPACALRGRAAHAIGCAICRDGSSRDRTCNPPVKSRELCLLSYGAGTEGEGVEPPSPCGPPVFETGYRAGGSPSSGGTRQSRPSCDVAGRDRTCGAPRFRRALYRAELRPRASGASPSIHLPSKGDRRSGVRASVLCRVRPVDGAVFHATRSPFDPGSSTSGCASATGRRPTWRGSGARPSVRSEKLHEKYIFIFPDIFSRERVEPFSLERGLDSILCFFKLGIPFFLV